MRYERYKPSNLEWLPTLPEHWSILRLKDLGNLQNGISNGKDYFGFGFPFVSYGNVYNDAIRLSEISTLANSTKEEQKVYSVLEGDVFFTRTSETIDEIGIASTCQITIPKATYSGFTIRLRPKPRLIVKEFSRFFFRANINRQFLSKEISLVTRASLSQNLLSNLPVLLPSQLEQTAIAQYLDSKTQAIDKKINLLTQKANYYKELRKSIINDAVCKGLEKNAKLKESGIDWIGKIPEHWEVKRLKALGEIESSSVNKKIEEDEELVKLVNYTDVYGNMNKEIWNNDNYMVVSANKLQVRYKRLRQGDVLFTPSSETIEDIGVSAVVMEDLKNTLYSYHILRLKFTIKMQLNFKKYLFNNDFVQEYFSKSATGTTRKILGLNTFYNLPIVYPPTIKEQTAIANYLDEKTQKIDAIVSNIGKQIDILKELRKTLINDVVTGKIKVANN
jgi:type I restriction enzyme S subunit